MAVCSFCIGKFNPGGPLPPECNLRCKPYRTPEPSGDLTNEALRRRASDERAPLVALERERERKALKAKDAARKLDGAASALAEMERRKLKASDPETAPQHYRGDGMEPWAVWEAFDLDPWAANVVKYILRAGKKGPALPDLKKARHYLDYMIEKEESE